MQNCCKFGVFCSCFSRIYLIQLTFLLDDTNVSLFVYFLLSWAVIICLYRSLGGPQAVWPSQWCGHWIGGGDWWACPWWACALDGVKIVGYGRTNEQGISRSRIYDNMFHCLSVLCYYFSQQLFYWSDVFESDSMYQCSRVARPCSCIQPPPWGH